jgi:hypothetical protein
VFVTFLSISFFELISPVEATVVMLARSGIITFVHATLVVLVFLTISIGLLISLVALILIMHGIFALLNLWLWRWAWAWTAVISFKPFRFVLLVGPSISYTVCPFRAGASRSFVIPIPLGIGGHSLFMVDK